jgi:DNA segregation ATPase FtsK/SpoIIIE-like protein
MTQKKQSSDGLEKFLIALFLFLGILSKVAFSGFKLINFKNTETLVLLFLITVACLIPPSWKFFQVTEHFWINYLWYLFLAYFTTLILMGAGLTIKHAKMQNALNFSGLKNTQGIKPKLVNIIQIDEYRTKLIIASQGIGPNRYESKVDDLESAFKQKIEKVCFSKDRDYIKIYLCARELPTMIPYSETLNLAKKEGSFLLGESLTGGYLTQEIASLPHLLIGGTTGGGKSVFFKNTILNLLKTTPHLQMFLIDLKKGLEVKEFSDLPNVTIAKDESEAVQVLQAIQIEMTKRYEYLESKTNRKLIDPRLDNRDMIVIGIDEASVLYGKTNSNKRKKELTEKARDLTDELAKLARAAGIHLIIATQKPIKESIDTKTLENLPGRMSFKMSTHPGSNSMLGNGKAFTLPDIKGRAIWKGGNQYIELQTAYITEEEIQAEIDLVKEGFEGGKYKNLQPLIQLKAPEVKGKNVLDQEVQDAS